MNQILKISISRGACRFATPLYLGGKYDITFSGERSDEAKTILFTKCKSKNPNKTDGIEALAISTTSEEGDVSMNLNKQVLVDFFKKSGECDVDGNVDVHAYIFDENGVVLADSDVNIEFKPIDFVIDAEDINRYGNLLARIVAVEDRATDLEHKDIVHEASLAQLAEVDENNKVELTAEIIRRAEAVLSDAKNWASRLAVMIARVSYIRCTTHTSDKDLYHKIDVVINEHGECVLRVDQTPVQFDGSDEGDQVNFLYSDEAQDIVADKVFKGCKLTISNDGAKVGSFYVANGADFDVHTQAKFLNGLAVTGDASVDGDLSVTGDASVDGDLSVDGDVNVSSDGHITGHIHNSSASVVTAVRNVADNDDANNAASTHWVRTRIANWWTDVLATIRELFVDFTSSQTITGSKTFVGRYFTRKFPDGTLRDASSRSETSYCEIPFRDSNGSPFGDVYARADVSGANNVIVYARKGVGGVDKNATFTMTVDNTGKTFLKSDADVVRSDAIAGAGFPDVSRTSTKTVTLTANAETTLYSSVDYDCWVSASANLAIYTGAVDLIVKNSSGTELYGQHITAHGVPPYTWRGLIPLPKGCKLVALSGISIALSLRAIKLKGLT